MIEDFRIRGTNVARRAAARLPLFIVVSILVLDGGRLSAQDPPPDVVTLAGMIVGQADRVPIRGALVLVPRYNQVAVTDSLGRFRFSKIPVGEHTIVVRGYGYREAELTVTVARDSAFVEITLVPDPVPLQGLRVESDDSVALNGSIVDAASGTPLRGASVVEVGSNRGVLSDSLGSFSLTLAAGDYLLLVRQFGYESLYVPERAGGEPPLRIPLRPSPLALEGLTVEVMSRNVSLMEQRIRSRRNAAPVSVRAFERERLLATASSNVFDFLRLEAFIDPVSCVGSGFVGNVCIFRRGRMTEPSIFIDEVPAFGGLDQLVTYRPQDIYLIEVWSSGSAIRVYTHQFMERMATRPIQLIY
jgi:hypothetical protein